MKQQFKTPLTALAYNNQYQQGQSGSYQPRPAQSIQALNPFGACTCYQRELLRHNSGFLCDAESVDTLPLSCEESSSAQKPIRAGRNTLSSLRLAPESTPAFLRSALAGGTLTRTTHP